MRTADFDFDLPEELIAQEPASPRGSSRLLAAGPGGGLADMAFGDLPGLLMPGDLLVVNDSRVVPARLFATKPTGGQAELLLLEKAGEGEWEALLRSSKRTRPGTLLTLSDGETLVEVLEERGEGIHLVRFAGSGDPDEAVERLGIMPLPPYIRRENPKAADREWYQTVYSDLAKKGSAAAPTAGLHFTAALLEELVGRGVERVSVTLHVGLGTFQPVRVEDVSSHRMHGERYEVTPEAATAVNSALDEGRRVVAVGTTATRVLEHAGASGRVEPGRGTTSLFIVPGYEFRIVKALVTNFHLPESTLLMLVCAFGGRERVMEAYRHAVEKRYRFYSYGDAMFIS